METSRLNNPFYTLNVNPLSGRLKRGKERKRNIELYDQRILESSENQKRSRIDYLLDSISEVIGNQSLSQEQIARSQKKLLDSKLDSLVLKYKISKMDEIKIFLSKNKFLIELLEEIPSKIYQYFGANQELALEVSSESEFPDASEIWVEILTKLSAREVAPILEEFDKEWWFENLDRANYKLSITLKFV